ncbi:MAG: hypothetical protein ACKOWW_03140 [Flavobacteriales bacterium]
MIRGLGLLALLCLVFACQQDPYEVTIETLPNELKQLNLDSALRSKSEQKLSQYVAALYKQDFEAIEFCFSYALDIPLKPDSVLFKAFKTNTNNPFNAQVFNALDTMQHWRSNVSFEISNAFKRLKVLAPALSRPKQLYFAYTQFAASAYCSKQTIVIGQERYLGPQHPIIKMLPEQQFYRWIKNGLVPKYASTDAIAVWLSTNILKETDENFASEMIRWGKILAILDILLPEQTIATKLRYETKAYEWALASESKFWEYLVEQQLLFKTDLELNMNLLDEGPYSIGLPQESPDRMGRFLGYQIVKQYLDAQQPSIEELINTPYNRILQKYQVPK